MTAWVFLGALGLGASAPLADQTDQETVLAVVDTFLDAINARDTAAYRALTLPAVQNLIVVSEGDSTSHQWRSNEESIRGLGADGPQLLERMWDAQVQVHGPIASVWTPYDFYRDGAFSHCGVDAFHLVRDADGWKITAIMYTVVRTQSVCDPSPLGPPKS